MVGGGKTWARSIRRVPLCYLFDYHYVLQLIAMESTDGEKRQGKKLFIHLGQHSQADKNQIFHS